MKKLRYVQDLNATYYQVHLQNGDDMKKQERQMQVYI